jgi:hypothetical protein
MKREKKKGRTPDREEWEVMEVRENGEAIYDNRYFVFWKSYETV